MIEEALRAIPRIATALEQIADDLEWQRLQQRKAEDKTLVQPDRWPGQRQP